MKKLKIYSVATLSSFLLFSSGSFSQTNVFDNVIATSPNHTYLEAALIQEGLVSALQNQSATLTVPLVAFKLAAVTCAWFTKTFPAPVKVNLTVFVGLNG